MAVESRPVRVEIREAGAADARAHVDRRLEPGEAVRGPDELRVGAATDSRFSPRSSSTSSQATDLGAHFDIGPAHLSRRRPDDALDPGGTGHGVCLLADLAEALL